MQKFNRVNKEIYTTKRNIKYERNNIHLKKFLLLNNLLIVIYIYIYFYRKIKDSKNKMIFKSSNKKDYTNNNFAIIKRECSICGLFSFYMVSLGCIHKYLLEGYIPIIDIKSFPNVINGFNTSKQNYWEIFFEQPFGYTLESVLKKAKNITYISCDDCSPRPDEYSMLLNEPRKNFWHNFANKYLLIKREIIDLANKIKYRLFKNTKNILGVLTRGTDYISKKPKFHPIPPNVSDLIHDVKKMDNKYKYDFIFFSTEDEIIRKNFTKCFNNKVKILKSNININYDYKKSDYLNVNDNIKGNIEFNKIYLLNIIILSKCLDIITARCSGTAGIFVLTNGFRNIKIYNLGTF